MVELLYTEGCPHADAYLPRLRRLAAGAGIADPIQERLVTSDEQAPGGTGNVWDRRRSSRGRSGEVDRYTRTSPP